MPSDRFPGEWEPVNLWISEEEETKQWLCSDNCR